MCEKCEKPFDLIMTISEREKARIQCPTCKGTKVAPPAWNLHDPDVEEELNGPAGVGRWLTSTSPFRRAAILCGQGSEGCGAGDLPVEQPTRFDLVINLKTAKAIGLTIPQSLLGRADQIIE